MKKLHLLGMAMIIALAFASCGSNKQMVNNQPQQQQTVQQQQQQQQQQEPAQQPTAQKPQTPVEIDLDIPCYEASRSTETEFREYGVGENVNDGKARIAAVNNAYAMMERRLSRVVNGVKDEYSRTLSKQEAEEVEDVLEDAYHSVIKGALQASDNPCEKRTWNPNANTYKYYYTIAISKYDFGTKLQKELSKNEKFGVLFDQKNFFDKYGNVLGIDQDTRE